MSHTGESAAPRPAKSASAFRTIGEVADDLELPAHVLRFWESKFPQLKPLKRGGGRRYYRPEDIVLLRRIRQCLYQDGYTIRGVQKLLGDPPGEPNTATIETSAIDDEEMPTLFPREAMTDAPRNPRQAMAAAPDEPGPTPPQPRRRPARRNGLDPAVRAALEEIRLELREARALLETPLPTRGD